jgi:hypothetical protein
MIRARLFLAFLLPLPVLGCGGPALSEAWGTVTLNNQPVPNAEVVFLPDSTQGTEGPRSSAITDAEGRFILRTDDGRPGAVVGKHRVTVRTSPPREDRGRDGEGALSAPADRPAYVPISLLYGKTDSSNPLGVTEVTADNHTYDLPLK